MGITITRPKAKRAKRVKRGRPTRARGVKKVSTTTIVRR